MPKNIPKELPARRLEAQKTVSRFFTENAQPLTGVILATQNDTEVFPFIQNPSYLDELTYLFDQCKFPLFHDASNAFDSAFYSRVVVEFSRKLGVSADDLPGLVFFDDATIQAGQFAYLKLQDFSTGESLRVLRDLSDFLYESKDWSIKTVASYNRNKGFFLQRRTEGPQATMRSAGTGQVDVKQLIQDFVVDLAVETIVAFAKKPLV
jgi:hypothetical protein